jgi:hypothetical protein
MTGITRLKFLENLGVSAIAGLYVMLAICCQPLALRSRLPQQLRQLRHVGRDPPLGGFAISSCLLDVLVFLSRTGRPCEAQREDAKVTVRLALTVRFRSANRKTPSWGDKAKPPVFDRPTALLFDP